MPSPLRAAPRAWLSLTTRCLCLLESDQVRNEGPAGDCRGGGGALRGSWPGEGARSIRVRAPSSPRGCGVTVGGRGNGPSFHSSTDWSSSRSLASSPYSQALSYGFSLPMCTCVPASMCALCVCMHGVHVCTWVHHVCWGVCASMCAQAALPSGLPGPLLSPAVAGKANFSLCPPLSCSPGSWAKVWSPRTDPGGHGSHVERALGNSGITPGAGAVLPGLELAADLGAPLLQSREKVFGRKNTSMFPRGWNQAGSCGSRVLTTPSFASSRSCFYPHLGTHLAERGLNFFWTQPCVHRPSPGPFSRTQRMARFTLPASSSAPPGWEPRGSLRWGRAWWPQGGGREPSSTQLL